jgi:hypothetical protein
MDEAYRNSGASVLMFIYNPSQAPDSAQFGRFTLGYHRFIFEAIQRQTACGYSDFA